MAQSKELVVSDTTELSEFSQDFLMFAQRTALLYHLSYLQLGQFSVLERPIRMSAYGTQDLFESSEAVLLKCVGTSSNLVNYLFPMLMRAVEMNKPVLAVKYLDKTKTWIDDIISAVDDIVERYGQQSRSVAECTSDVIQEQNKTEARLTQPSVERKRMELAIANLKEDLEKYAKDIEEIEGKIKEKNDEMKKYLMKVSVKKHGFGILFSLVPHFPSFIKSIYNAFTAPGVAGKTHDLNAQLSHLTSEKRDLQHKEFKLQLKLNDLQQKLDSSQVKQGVIQASPVHLKNAQSCLNQIQKTMVQLKKFWENIGSLLENLKDRTFLNEFLIDDHEMKDDFLQSIEIAAQCWNKFGQNCHKASSLFRVQSKDAYQFLETNPSSLSDDEWKEQYESVMNKLKQINFQKPPTAAITDKVGFAMSGRGPSPRTKFKPMGTTSNLPTTLPLEYSSTTRETVKIYQPSTPQKSSLIAGGPQSIYQPPAPQAHSLVMGGCQPIYQPPAPQSYSVVMGGPQPIYQPPAP